MHDFLQVEFQWNSDLVLVKQTSGTGLWEEIDEGPGFNIILINRSPLRMSTSLPIFVHSALISGAIDSKQSANER
jgi:hypothetical protein